MKDVRVIADIPLASGRGRRVAAIDDEGTGHLFTILNEFGDAQTAEKSFTAEQAVQVAQDVLAGRERTVTASWPLHVLAASVLLLDHQLTPKG